MEKTKEEIRKAVLAECERLTRDVEPLVQVYPLCKYSFDDERPQVWVAKFSLSARLPTYYGIGGLGRQYTFSEKDTSISNEMWLCFYRLLGLEARDAVAAKDAEIERLVEALEESLNEDYCDFHDAMGIIENCKEVLEAYKKGGQSNG